MQDAPEVTNLNGGLPNALVASGEQMWPFHVRRSTPVIGAEITGIDLGEPLSDDIYNALRRALVKFKVLFFRDQDITPAQHVAAARRFGKLECHPVFDCHPDHPELVMFNKSENNKGRENIYHSDVSWREIPSMGSMLRCVECPEAGGDTIWVNMVAAFANLPDDVKGRIAHMQAFHDAYPMFARRAKGAELDALRGKYPPMLHPVVRTHPENGEKILFVNQAFTTHLCSFSGAQEFASGFDMRAYESDFLQYLLRQAALPEYQVRLKWEPNTIAFWDNRSTQHYAVQDYYPAVRRMMRATIIGERPF